jgi:hypothetical protein
VTDILRDHGFAQAVLADQYEVARFADEVESQIARRYDKKLWRRVEHLRSCADHAP